VNLNEPFSQQSFADAMTRQQLERKRDGLEAQMHWATLHRGDQELMDVLRDESDRLSRDAGSAERVSINRADVAPR
jgi:hypothetical protein